MSGTSKIITHVLDAGGRYGLHPTWKPFDGELDYYLFEPDPAESERLRAKYARRANEVKIIDRAVTQDGGNLQIHFFRNRAMSSSVARNPVSSLFRGERLPEVDIVETLEVDAVSIDSFSAERGIALDFLKLDTEGTEFSILQGAQSQLEQNVLGIRCEVSFDVVFEGMPMFGEIHRFLFERNFFLLNLDYNGKGDYQNDFVNAAGRYGILTATDGVWLRRLDVFFDSTPESEREARALKYAAFCLMNHAPDVAIAVLFEARNRGADFDRVQQSRLYRFVNIGIQKHFYSLKWQPGQSLKGSHDAYLRIFGKKMKAMNEYMESLELNPD